MSNLVDLDCELWLMHVLICLPGHMLCAVLILLCVYTQCYTCWLTYMSSMMVVWIALLELLIPPVAITVSHTLIAITIYIQTTIMNK